MREFAITLIVGLVFGGILAAAQYFIPAAAPFVLGYMLACTAANLRHAMRDK